MLCVIDRDKKSIKIVKEVALSWEDVQQYYDDAIFDYTNDYADYITDEQSKNLENYHLTDLDKLEILDAIKTEWENLNCECSKMMDIDTMYSIHDEDVIMSGVKNWIKDNLL